MRTIMGLKIKAFEVQRRWKGTSDAMIKAFEPWPQIAVCMDRGDIYVGYEITCDKCLLMQIHTVENLKAVLVMGLSNCGIMDARGYDTICVYVTKGG